MGQVRQSDPVTFVRALAASALTRLAAMGDCGPDHEFRRV